jgi:hypothetical protein
VAAPARTLRLCSFNRSKQNDVLGKDTLWHLGRRGGLKYAAVRSQNELTGFGFAKDYDAIVTVRTEAGEQRFALEYERSPKPMRYYRDVAASLSREAHVHEVLYLVSNYDLLQFVSSFFRNSQCRVFFGLVKDWHSQLLDMPVSCSSATRYFRLRETLDDAAAHVEAAVISA